ncbi:TonB-linked SusC/RagA family outer membrane protein [Hymenobacter luteus]|uniref:TonB-linked SusC/RagA family outer membrane protein n=2 Tax=Hymenobacter TaxID=89966 RepID=A0A7W9T4V3_9BACT|nr:MULTISPECIES: TonB-dependent receptor [Hymenobacter]MBB4603304.1 TonB-linked SusC/RagA family outer membrane protein [Hymenobacter latericoloratus]MBB6061138.1 TonB-linked SusC/RagA family outer membrane protein [Hymenobacter luteus]
MNQHLYPQALLRRALWLAACGLPALPSLAAVPSTAAGLPGPAATPRLLADVPVSGRVTQSNGEPLPGVTIIVKGTTLGTTTDADGRFSLNAPENSTLVVSYVGFTRREVPVTGASTSLSITLAEDTRALSEVVVVGYGTQERGSVTGAVSSVSAREIATQPVADATQALQGRAAGVTITSNGGAPGGAAGTSIRIRGLTSAGNNNPLFVVDGFPLPDGNENQLNAISPNDIETIDILKDASATAIYGVRAANGVVIITTKRGKTGTSTINLDAYRGVQQVWRKLDLLNAEEYAVINNEGRLAGGAPIVVDRLRNPQGLGEGTDWQDEVFRRAAIQNYSLSATGGSDKARYAVSASYFQQDGTIVGSDFERFTLRANGDVQVNKILKLGNNISLTHLSDRQITSNSGEYGTVQQTLRIPAIIPVYRPDGYYYEPRGAQDNFIEENPLASATITNQRFYRNRALTTFFAELEPVRGLRFRTNVGADFVFDNFNAFRPGVPELQADGQTYTSRYTQATAGATATASYAPSYLIENTATFDRLIADKHQVTVLVGQSAQQFNYSNVEAYRTGYLRNDLQVINSGPINTQIGNAGTINRPSRLLSYFGRVNYEFAGKYLFQAIARYDGSGSFPPGDKFGFFPGVSAGWRISEEDFLKGNRVISNLKLRVGYGKVGNPNNAGRFAYLYAINSGIRYPFGPGGGALQTGAAPTRQANPDLRWETNNQTNVGVDLGFLDNRFEATIDLYNRSSPNLIAPVPVSLVSGTYETVNRNAASAYNRGIDFSFTSHNVRGTGRSLNWTTTLNVSAYKSELESLGVGQPYNGLSALSGVIVRYDEGQPFGSFYGFVADGLFQTPEDVQNHATQQSGTAPGDIRFKDLNNDGVINAEDRTFIGNPNPDFTYGLNNTVTWGGFDLNVFLQGSQGNDIYNQNRYILESPLYGTSSGSTRVLGRWTGPGTSNDVPRAFAGDNADPNQNLRVSTYFVEDGSYMRIKTLTLGYSLPQSVMERIAAKQVRVYASAQNLLTLTKYSGYDPEVGARGIDLGVYPQPRVFLLGLNIGF